MQVRAVQPKTPRVWKVLRSVWAPAPPEASEPAMVRAMAVMPLACTGRGARAKPGRSHGAGPQRARTAVGSEPRFVSEVAGSLDACPRLTAG
ncbi:hypothetical protein ATCC27039_23100 [Actinomyces naeslundii]|nr:hypothetical protein ATCC27039_23100 [Actinomyces naeslundii]